MRAALIVATGVEIGRVERRRWRRIRHDVRTLTRRLGRLGNVRNEMLDDGDLGNELLHAALGVGVGVGRRSASDFGTMFGESIATIGEKAIANSENGVGIGIGRGDAGRQAMLNAVLRPAQHGGTNTAPTTNTGGEKTERFGVAAIFPAAAAAVLGVLHFALRAQSRSRATRFRR